MYMNLHFIQASEYNSDDSTLLYQLALCSVTLGDMALARPALEQVKCTVVHCTLARPALEQVKCTVVHCTLARSALEESILCTIVHS